MKIASIVHLSPVLETTLEVPSARFDLLCTEFTTADLIDLSE
ncbi:MAG: hypothetical protein WBD74_09720 [Candidatus Aquilonibacter sp.]